MSRLYPRSIVVQPQRAAPSPRHHNYQTPEYLAAIEREKHRAKLARNGEDTH